LRSRSAVRHAAILRISNTGADGDRKGAPLNNGGNGIWLMIEETLQQVVYRALQTELNARLQLQAMMLDGH
jgi:hypothetical protein